MALLKRIKQSQQTTPETPDPGAGQSTTPQRRELRTRRPAAAPARDTYSDIKTRIQNQLIAELDSDSDMSDRTKVRASIEQMMNEILAEESIVFGRRERQRLLDSIVAEILGYGPIQPFLLDESITEVMVNGYDQIYIERAGKLEKTNATFEDNDHVMRIIERIVQFVGRRIDEASPYVNARLPDGSRVNAIIPPLVVGGPTITIRKFFKNPLQVDDLIRLGTITAEGVEFLRACVQAKVNILISGGTGTGKTMAADIMAGELELDLYKIDLSLLVSKYIGETEKNLNKVFTEAETSNAIIFFDEADAIFGKRSEVKDSHDRYANVEISYLLQRMEAYDGVVILATNMRANLDEAFTRRLHFIVEFPFPEAPDREVIWKVNIPSETPVAEDIDFRLLGERYRVAGGNIRNIIMAAAFLAADDGQVVSMNHLFHAARREYQKIGRLIDESLFQPVTDGEGH